MSRIETERTMVKIKERQYLRYCSQKGREILPLIKYELRRPRWHPKPTIIQKIKARQSEAIAKRKARYVLFLLRYKLRLKRR